MGKVLKSKSNTRAGLADALFTTTQQRVLGILFGHTDRSFYLNELIGLAAVGAGAVQRELKRCMDAGLITMTKVGNQKHYQANHASPLFEPLVDIVIKTVGLADPIKLALGAIEGQIKVAFIFGSVAKKTDTSASDIDLMVISDTISYADVFAALEATTQRLGRPINPTVYTYGEWSRRLKENNSFTTRILAQPKIWLIGGPDALNS